MSRTIMKETASQSSPVTLDAFRSKVPEKPVVLKSPDIPLNIWERSAIVVTTNDVVYLTHAFHKFPAKFIPQIPRWAIRRFLSALGKKESARENLTVLDPFCGSGTTLVEAKLANIDSYGIDIDPLAILITKVKTTSLKPSTLAETARSLISNIKSDKGENITLPIFPNRDYWFQPEVSKSLAIIKKHISAIRNPDYRDFFLLCLSSIIRDVSNADAKQIILARTKVMRELEAMGRRIDAIKSFITRVHDYKNRMIRFTERCRLIDPEFKTKAEIIGKDARNIELKDESVDLMITSPPYINAIDYVRVHKLELYWLGLLNHEKPLDLKKKFIGTEIVSSKEYVDIGQTGLPELDGKIRQIYAKNKRLAYIVYKYFYDMNLHFAEIGRVLRPGGVYCIAIGGGTISKVPIPAHKYFMEALERLGFVKEHSFLHVFQGMHLGIPRIEDERLIKSEWVLTFKRGPSKS